MTRRTYKRDDARVAWALQDLRQALVWLKQARAFKTAARVRAAISSCKGAVRNIDMLRRSQEGRNRFDSTGE